MGTAPRPHPAPSSQRQSRHSDSDTTTPKPMLFSLSGTECTLTVDILELYDMSGGQRCHQENLLLETSLRGQDIGRTWKKKPLLCSKGSITNQTSRGRHVFQNQTKQTKKHKLPDFSSIGNAGILKPLAQSPQKCLSPLLHDPALPAFPGEQTSLHTVSRGFSKTPPMRKGKEKLGPGRSEEHLDGTEYYLI